MERQAETSTEAPEPTQNTKTKRSKPPVDVHYTLNILWQEQFCAVSVDQVVAQVGAAHLLSLCGCLGHTNWHEVVAGRSEGNLRACRETRRRGRR